MSEGKKEQIMKTKSIFLAPLLALAFTSHAASPSAERMLPQDTLGMVSVPDWDKASEAYRNASWAQLWRDPAMKPFTDKFYKKFNEDAVEPLERELGVKLSDYTGLIHGQVTLAVLPKKSEGSGKGGATVVVLVDSRDKADQLKKLLADAKKRWVDSGKKVKTETVRDVEFTTLVDAGKELTRLVNKTFSTTPKAETDSDDDKDSKGGLAYGMQGSLLLVGTNPRDFEKVLATQSGGIIPSLAELPAYQADQGGVLRDATGYLWVNFKPIVEMLMKTLGSDGAAESSPLGLKPAKILEALGIADIKTISIAARQTSDGTSMAGFVSAPESARKGLLKIFATESKEYSPPAFVSTEITEFTRTRIDVRKAFATIENTLKDLSPQLFGLAQMTLEAAGKDRDPNFDLRKQLIGNLGDDIMALKKAPKGSTMAAIQGAPSLVLVSSPNSQQLAEAIKTVASLGSPPDTDTALKEREFLGRKIYSLPSKPGLPWVPAGTNPGEARPMQFAASGGYVAFSSDSAMLEEYLRSDGTTSKSLRQTPGLSEAMEKVGGPGTFFFGFNNTAVGAKILLELVKNDPDALQKAASANPLAAANPLGQAGKLKEYFDFSLLPSFDRISKYFNFSVYGAGSNSEGISFQAFDPTPPELKK
jgi:hypothetical protein